MLSSEAGSVKLARGGKGGKAGGNVNVTSTPSGGRVFLNGQDTGKMTPALLTNVPKGTATVTVRKDGFQDCTKTVRVKPKGTVNVTCQLSPTEGGGGSGTVLVFPTYYPLNPGDVYNYGGRRSDGTTFVSHRIEVRSPAAGSNLIPLFTDAGRFKNISFVTVDSTNGFQIHKVQDSDCLATYSPPMRIPHGLQMGASFSQAVNAVSNCGGFIARGTVSRKVTFEGLETVTVPAGTFANCAKVIETMTADNQTISITYFLAPGIGPVKTINTFEGTLELISATIGGRTMP
jgi:hypothetical protein